MNLVFSRRHWRIGAGVAALALSVAASSAMASTVTFTAPDITVAQSGTAQTYTADVLISDTNTSDIINDFQLDLFVQPTATFSSAAPGLNGDVNVAYGATTGFDLNTTSVSTGGNVISNSASAPYLYNNPGNPNNSNDITFASPQYLADYTTTLAGPQQAGANEAYANDTWANTDVAQMTQTWAIARVYITVAAGFTGTEYLVWNNNGTNNDAFAPFYSLSTATTNNLDPNLIGGVITVLSPEPSSVVLLVLGAVGLFGVRRLRGRRG